MTPRAPMESAQFPARQDGGEVEAGRAGMPVDTSAEAIGRSITELMSWLTGPDSGQNDGLVTAANQLAALVRERDAMLASLLNLAEAMEGQNRDSPHSMRMAIPGWAKTARAAIALAERAS